jgi:hypothetical protein
MVASPESGSATVRVSKLATTSPSNVNHPIVGPRRPAALGVTMSDVATIMSDEDLDGVPVEDHDDLDSFDDVAANDAVDAET